MKASTNVRHIVIPRSSSARAQLIPDIIRCYSSGGRTIIFTETKDSASEHAGLLPGARVLHGDIQQATHEVTFSGFRSGKFMTMVATNVAARGLDINDVVMLKHTSTDLDVQADQGYTEIKKRSLLTCMENYVALVLEAGRPIYTLTWWYLASCQENAANVSIEVLGELPRLQERDSSRGERFGSSSRGVLVVGAVAVVEVGFLVGEVAGLMDFLIEERIGFPMALSGEEVEVETVESGFAAGVLVVGVNLLPMKNIPLLKFI
ncbi:hypothetical protein Ancab_010181 [Ancistrocladus abbreviatus]